MDKNIKARDGGLFQSNLWKEFQKSLDKEIFETEYFWGIIETATILGRYGEISRGPIQGHIDQKNFEDTCKKIREEQRLSFLRIEPQNESFLENFKDLKLVIRKAPLDVQPREILMLPISSEQELFVQMKSKTRYNIRLAQKKGVKIKALETEEEEKQFLDLLASTADRKKITFHSRNYYQAFIRFFNGDRGQTFIAVHNNQVLAGSTLVFFDTTAYYVHGGSSSTGRNAMAPHLLQWEQIRYALNQGLKQYDFGGVQIQSGAKKDWSGITRFKTGFAPHVSPLLFPGTYDIIFSPTRYWSYLFLARIKKLFL